MLETDIPSASSSPPRRSIVGLRRLLVAVLVAAAASFYFRGEVLSLERGLEFTDEGLYLLSANPASSSDSWWLPFGYITRWFFWIAASDVVAFRQLGLAVLLFVSTISLFCTLSLSQTRAVMHARQILVLDFGVLIVSSLSVVAFYSWFIRTPGYDWLALVGALLAVSGAVYLAVPGRAWSRRTPVIALEIPALSTLVVAAVFILFSRPQMLLWMLVMIVLLLRRRRSSRFSIFFVILWGTLTVLAGAAVLLASSGVQETTAVVARIADYQPVSGAQTPVPALVDFLTWPVTITWNFWLSPRPQKYLLIVLFVFLVLVSIRKIRPAWGEKILALVLIGASFTLVSLVTGPNYLDLQIEAAVAAVLAITLLALYAHLPLFGRDTAFQANLARNPDTSSPLGLFVGWTLLGAFLFGVGSTNGVAASSSRAMPLLAVSLVAASIWGMPRPRLVVSGLVVVIVVCGCSLSMVASGYQRPLNLPSAISDQVVPTRISTYGTLFLDKTSAAYVDELSELARSTCLSERQQVLGLEYQWSTTDVFLIKGWNPPSIILGIMYANDAYFDNLQWSLDQLPKSQWSRAWIIKSRSGAIPQEYRPVTDRAVDMTTDHLGTSFPSDYVLAATVGSTEFWAPRDSEITCDSFRDTRTVDVNFPASVTNRMPEGWRPRGLNLARTW